MTICSHIYHTMIPMVVLGYFLTFPALPERLGAKQLVPITVLKKETRFLIKKNVAKVTLHKYQLLQ